MKRVLLICVVLLVVPYGRADNQPPLAISAVHTIWEADPNLLSGATADSKPKLKNLYIWVILKNTSNLAINVPTKMTDTEFGSFGDGLEFRFRVAPISNPTGIETIIPESSLAIVELKPGESAVIKWHDIVPAGRLAKVNISYSVKKNIADRYKLWCGEIHAISEKKN